MADAGHHHVVLVGETPQSGFGKFRIYEEYVSRARERAAKRGMRFKVVNPPTGGVAGVERVASALLSDCDDRLALITRGPLATDWMSRLLEKNGILPGKDVSLVGVVDDHTATSAKITLTNVSPRPQAVSRLAVEMLLARIDDPSIEQQVKPVYPQAISFRDSSVDWE
nr:substrate-binding domain-containing protein [Bifidobacterium avesanii]